MTYISKVHKRLSERLLKDPRVLTNPEEFLGPNYKAVLNYWMILDELSKDQWRTIKSRYDDFYINQRSEWRKAVDEAHDASVKTIRRIFTDNSACAAWDVYFFAALCVTKELIGMHKLFEQNKPLTFFEMFLDL